MVKFKAIKFRYLPNTAHYQYCSWFRDRLNAAPEIILQDVAPVLPKYSTWLDRFAAIIEWTAKSDLTAQIIDANKRMDSDLSGFRAHITACFHSSNESVATAANRILIMLKEYGRVANKPYEEEMGDIHLILNSLTTTYAGDVTACAATSWKNHLQASYGAFVEIINLRNARRAEKPQYDAKTARVELQTLYNEMTVIISSKSIAVPEPYSNFIHVANIEIDRVNIEFNRVLRNIATCEPEPIPEQIYTGLPLTPTPVVLYVTPHDGTVRLELGRDYNLSYHNNVKVGNAECIVHGKGGYRGSRTVTFAITRQQ
ncbi:MAG: DUF6261 family protein [Tannerella sp.]|jgi:hypothetical protein|nr:DUF6261 family protein [Tannerella sp.]